MKSFDEVFSDFSTTPKAPTVVNLSMFGVDKSLKILAIFSLLAFLILSIVLCFFIFFCLYKCGYLCKKV